MRFVLPEENARWDERASFRCLPLADCLLALVMLANGVESGGAAGKERLLALRRRMSAAQQRAVAASFDASFPFGTLAFSLVPPLPDATDHSALVAAVRAVPESAVVLHALSCTGALRPDAPHSPGVFRSLMGDPAWTTEYIQRFLYPVPADTTGIIESVTHPARVRDDLADLLAGLFADLFAPLIPELRATGRAAEARMQARYAGDPAAFVMAQLPDTGRDAARALFWPSVYLGDGWAIVAPDGAMDTAGDDRVRMITYGAEMLSAPLLQDEDGEPTIIVPEVAPPETYQEVYRLLADPARWTLITLLVAAPRYGQELSELLGLSIATVSHHLNVLKRLDLVDIRRDEHRLYYHLRTDRLRALLAGAEAGLLAP